MQHFFNENRIRQAASSLGAAQFCINESVQYAKDRKPFGKALATNQAIQFPLAELQTQCEMLRALIHKTAWEMDNKGTFSCSDKVSMCNFWANRLCCQAADRAMQVHGGLGYSQAQSRSSIYIGTIADTASPKEQKRYSCDVLLDTSLALCPNEPQKASHLSYRLLCRSVISKLCAGLSKPFRLHTYFRTSHNANPGSTMETSHYALHPGPFFYATTSYKYLFRITG